MIVVGWLSGLLFSPPKRARMSGQVKPLASLAAFSRAAVRSLCSSGMAHSGPASPKMEALVARPPSANSFLPVMLTVIVRPF